MAFREAAESFHTCVVVGLWENSVPPLWTVAMEHSLLGEGACLLGLVTCGYTDMTPLREGPI